MNGLYDASSPSSSGSSPRSNTSSHTSFSPLPSIPSPQETSMNNPLSNMFDFSADAKSALFDGGPLSCGFCNATSTCVCKDITMQQVSEQLSLSNISAAAVDHSDMQQSNALPNDAPPSILENLPEYQAPVPLRRRAPAQAARPIFPISPAPIASNNAAVTCSGDPSNCLACADDAFGKAFCDAISKTVASTSSSCGYCPDPSQASNDGAAVNGCCGNPIACGGMDCSPATADMSAPASLGGNDGSMMMTDEPSTSETISCDNAWRQLKSHPNVAFADLSLLAEVVARRSKCTGPRVEILPAPGSVTPERALSPPAGTVSHANTNQHSQHSFSDPRATYDESRGMGGAPRSPPPQLVPQEVLISCGRQRVREVMADGVRDALRILDAKFPVPGRMSNFRM
ncbi:uncharacterized protein LAESUDRAFT_205184 [Laetiporus sulphureus 93-53]|uniref:Uncharacterized protein n=1 Tax=Laetiporus sulphureus 93-53 TaxID=1314785 RepID=A0A165DYP7_9APHY|nr:uncharacterized protein LAESUDRAFT_205184 [Laetiporus sulphureus 93-53]KZT05901.1 hypothetical protein LAESUDRAFT_205184 [Laetiporus sulphureus 93-53]